MCDRTAWQRMAAVTVMMLVGAATAFAQDRPREPRRDGPPRPEVAQKDTKNDDVIAQLREEVLRLRHQLEAFQSQGQKPGDRDGKAAPDRGTAARPEARGSRDEGKEEGSRMNRGSWGRQQGPMAGGSEGWGNRGRGMFGGRDGFRGQAGPSPMAGGQNAVVQARELLEQAKALIARAEQVLSRMGSAAGPGSQRRSMGEMDGRGGLDGRRGPMMQGSRQFGGQQGPMMRGPGQFGGQQGPMMRGPGQFGGPQRPMMGPGASIDDDQVRDDV